MLPPDSTPERCNIPYHAARRVKKDRDEKSLSFCNVGAFIERPRATLVAPTNLFFMVGKTCFMEDTPSIELFVDLDMVSISLRKRKSEEIYDAANSNRNNQKGLPFFGKPLS